MLHGLQAIGAKVEHEENYKKRTKKKNKKKQTNN